MTEEQAMDEFTRFARIMRERKLALAEQVPIEVKRLEA
jgi:hypothetical protein